MAEDKKQQFLSAVHRTRETFAPIILSDNGWNFSSEKDLVRIYTRSYENGLDLVKGVAIFKNLQPPQFMKYISSDDLSFRQSWDSVVSKNEYIERYSETFEVIHNEYKLPVITRRDFIHAKEVFTADNGSLDAVSTSVDDIITIPQKNNVVRGQFKVTWWHAEPKGNDMVCIFSHLTELQGWIPNWVVSMSVTDSPRMLAKLAKVIGTELLPHE